MGGPECCFSPPFVKPGIGSQAEKFEPLDVWMLTGANVRSVTQVSGIGSNRFETSHLAVSSDQSHGLAPNPQTIDFDGRPTGW